MPPARAVLVVSSLAGVGLLLRTLLVGPPPLVFAVTAFAMYVALVAVGVAFSGLSMFADVVTRGPVDARGVALTFDDGPDPRTTPRLLDALDAAGAKATFFLRGALVDQHPDLARSILSRGHGLGLFGFAGRRRLVPRDVGGWQRELERERDAVERATGYRVRLFRAARGFLTPAKAGALRRLGFVVIGGSAGAGVGRSRAPDRERAVTGRLIDGAIVALAHTSTPMGGNPASLDALSAVLAAMARLQLCTVRLDEWLVDS